MATTARRPQSRRAGIRSLGSTVSQAPSSSRLEPILTSKNSSSAAVAQRPAPTDTGRRSRRRVRATVRKVSLRGLLPGWVVRAALLAAVIGSSWLALVWVMVTQDPAQSASRLFFIIAVGLAIFFTSLPAMHHVFSRFAPSRLQRGDPVLVVGNSFLLSGAIVANLSLMLAGSWNVTMFMLIAAITVVVESLFLACR